MSSVNKAVGFVLLLPYLLLFLAGCNGNASGMIQVTSSPTANVPRVTPTATVEVKPTVTPVSTPTPTPAPTPTLPTRMVIPDIRVDVEMVQLGLEKDGSLGSPNGPDVVGWFTGGPRPGQVGNVLASGHVDWADARGARTAVFWRLKELVPGSVVLIKDAQNQYKYVVRETLLYTWDDPQALVHLKQTPEPILTLITCEGVFYTATKNYDHRRVVVADLESSTPLDKLIGGST